MGMKSFNWRHEVVTAKPYDVTEVFFSDTKPNVFYVQNLNDCYVYFSLSGIPSTKKHEYEVRPMQSNAFGRPYGAQRLYIYNPSGVEITLNIWSDYQEFDISMLKNFVVDIGEDVAEAIRGDGVVKGVKDGVTFPISLPAGAVLNVSEENTPGIFTKVTNILTKLGDILTANNDIGTVLKTGVIYQTVNGILEKVTSVKDSFTTLLSDGVKIKRPGTVYSGGKTATGSTLYNFGESGTTSIKIVTNDGTNDISVIFNGENVAEFILKPGESITDIDVNATGISIGPASAGNEIVYRYMYTQY